MTTRPPPQARTLIFDLETTPNKTFSWGVWEQNAIEVIEEWRILCFSYKWLGEKKIHFVRPKWGVNDDKAIIQKLWKLFDKADILVAHNAQSFDVKKSHARFLHHKLKPPSPARVVDTKLIAKRKFNTNFYSLNELAKYMGCPYLKLKHKGFEMWTGCMTWKKKEWKDMERYNKRDVLVLDWVYQQMKPWDNQHPSISTEAVCQKCGSKEIRSKGFAFSGGKLKQRFVCLNCGGWGQYTKTGSKNV